METPDFFRSRIDAMINLGDPLAVLAKRLPWDQIETAVAAKFAPAKVWMAPICLVQRRWLVAVASVRPGAQSCPFG